MQALEETRVQKIVRAYTLLNDATFKTGQLQRTLSFIG
jgi:hypothetical protein